MNLQIKFINNKTSILKNLQNIKLKKERSVTRSLYLYYLSNSFFIGLKYNNTSIAPEFAQLNPSRTYVIGP